MMSGYDQWRALVEASLKGEPIEKLVSYTSEGLPIEPLYQPALTQPLLLPSRRCCKNLTRIHIGKNQANEQVLHDLEQGADGLVLVLPPDVRLLQLEDALQGVMLDLVHIRLDNSTFKTAQTFLNYCRSKHLDTRTLDLCLGLRPTEELLSNEPFSRSFLADGRACCEQGEAHELAFVLSEGVKIVRQSKHGLDGARHTLSFLLTCNHDQFITIVKFRAMRLLWAKIENVCGLEPQPIQLYAETSGSMMTAENSWNNVIRTTIASFSALVGGADTLYVSPHLDNDNDARRLARNMLLILRDEAGLSNTADPVLGSGTYEALTLSLCEKAWGLFQEQEAKL